jgi:6-phosphogluconolactonase/glucosamine-6-phosphate isomerase/deaminase
MPQTTIFADYPALCRAVADLVGQTVATKPGAIICLPSGDTPVGVFACLAADAQAGRLEPTQATWVGLDEWAGLGPTDEGSCQFVLQQHLFRHWPPVATRFLNAQAPDLAVECAAMNHWLDQRGGLDLMLVGLGMNGHIGLNEPGTPFGARAHVSELHPTTVTVGQKYFSRPTALTQGVTLGLGHFAQARLPILMAAGLGKAPVVQQALHGPVGEALPASILQTLPHAQVMLDVQAADYLTIKKD